jgi:prevent-host-death family protein
MKASILDLRRKMSEVLQALDRDEPVTITYRGKPKGIIYPIRKAERPSMRASEHPSFGMWRDREDMQDVDAYIRKLRKPRIDAL